jgi:hypothetical protein
VIRAQGYVFGRLMPEHELTATLTATIDRIRWRAAKPARRKRACRAANAAQPR